MSILELAVPVWNSSLTIEQINKIESVQKSSLSAILGVNYTSYSKALKRTGLERLSVRREQLCLNFITKNMKSEHPLLTIVTKIYPTRSDPKFAKEFQCRTSAFFHSSLPYLARLHNENMRKKQKCITWRTLMEGKLWNLMQLFICCHCCEQQTMKFRIWCFIFAFLLLFSK